MNVKKIIQNNIITITLWAFGVAFAGFNLYIASQLAPLAESLDVLATRVSAVEERTGVVNVIPIIEEKMKNIEALVVELRRLNELDHNRILNRLDGLRQGV